MSEHDKDDDPLARLRRAMDKTQDARDTSGEEAKAAQPEDENRHPFWKYLDRFKNSTSKTAIYARRAYETGEVIWNSKWFAALSLGSTFVAKKYWQVSKNLFQKWAFDKDGEYNKFKAAPLVAAWGVATPWLAFNGVTKVVIPLLVAFTTAAYDGAVINTFGHWDTHLYGKASILDADENIWTVSACDHFPCEGQVDTTAYRMRDSLYLDFQEFIERLEPHDPEELQAAFNSEQQACNVFSYGRRIKIPFAPASWGFFPHITEATCIPVDGSNWAEQLDFMRSQRPDIIAAGDAPAPEMQ